jgi:Ion channel
MNEFIITGILGIFLIAICSFSIYEILRITWNLLPKISWPPRFRVCMVVFTIFMGHILNIWLFGVVYYAIITSGLGKFVGSSIARGEYSLDIFGCIYISSVLYTTVGSGDITPEGSLRMIVGVEALTGFMLIGWTISFAYLAMEKFWQLPHNRRK